jgi:hypothetical protein
MTNQIRLVNDASDLAARDHHIETYAQVFDSLFGYATGDLLRSTWRRDIRPILTPCDCPLDPYHRWNCPLTPIWAQTMRDLDTNPWTTVTAALQRVRNIAYHELGIDSSAPWLIALPPAEDAR